MQTQTIIRLQLKINLCYVFWVEIPVYLTTFYFYMRTNIHKYYYYSAIYTSLNTEIYKYKLIISIFLNLFPLINN